MVAIESAPVVYRHFLSFLAVTIYQPKFHCVKQLYTPQLRVGLLFTVHTIAILVGLTIRIADLIGGAREGRIERGTLTPGHLWM